MRRWCEAEARETRAGTERRWTNPREPELGAVYSPNGAISQCRYDDERSARDHGSVTYRPTAEQAETSLCAALAAKGATEREVIEALFREVEQLRADMMKLAHAKASPLKVFIP